MIETCFFVTLPDAKERPTMTKRRVVDVDLYVEMLAARGRSGVIVQEDDGPALPYSEWRATRSEPLPPAGLSSHLMHIANAPVPAALEPDEGPPRKPRKMRTPKPHTPIDEDRGPDEEIRYVQG